MGTRIVHELVERKNGAQMHYRDAIIAFFHMIQSEFRRYRRATMLISTDCKQRSKEKPPYVKEWNRAGGKS